ncbi:hypothetical protein B0T26DRAFT_740667 [Lasiosphaeria miniovina]|uniref:Amidohydrolase-related domain-containing protein n=1 Tax=Lasiosphaeria miniovina TaxID=1954250 RepID=A0AA40AJY1_9PEZI|nr:uncharacterized protein B0T26DRAFT_740667 [Lasiosphaeria miniovina]KAK0717135.1 hypothetical protein B0T26DRAFT_740667 [Lasiosphaeria miniovina]
MARKTFTVHTSLLFDPKKKAFVENVSMEVDRVGGSIARVFSRDDDDGDEIAKNDDDIDLRGKVVLPGFVDSHAHIFIHSYDERPASEQMRDVSAVERIVRATNHARAALLAGYTTYRDLGTEALGAADANLRDCINRGITPGPRLFVATEALASSGSYETRVENRSLGGRGTGIGSGLTAPRASDAADGVDGVRAAVRRRVGDGADLIKFYADYRRKIGPREDGDILFPPARRNPAVPLFTQEEMDAIVSEANLAEIPVAAHCGETRTALMAARAGVTSVEHIFEDTHAVADELFAALRRGNVLWVPTLAAAELLSRPIFEQVKASVKRAHASGVRFAAGGDTGTFNHGLNARELEVMVEAGIPLVDVLVAATVGGWEACGGDRSGFRFGWFEHGNRADIIALDADPRDDTRALRKVSFVMKDGQVWKHRGQPVADMVPVPQWPDSNGGSSDGGGADSDECIDDGEPWTNLSAARPHRLSMSVPLPVYQPRNAPV